MPFNQPYEAKKIRFFVVSVFQKQLFTLVDFVSCELGRAKQCFFESEKLGNKKDVFVSTTT